MKKTIFLFASLFILFSVSSVNAQSKTGADYFSGKWHVLIPGTPLGDLSRYYIFEKKGDSLTGYVQDVTTGAEIAKYDSIELKGDQVTVFYNASDLDVSLVLIKKDEDNITGSLLGAYNVTGKRAKTK